MFAKIFSQIYDSSIVENTELRFTFMDMLVLADRNGVVDMTHEAISRRTNRPIELIRKTILELESPDEKSRTPDFNGARIKRLDDHRDWGWMIVNYDRFRQTASEEQRRQNTLSRVHKHRKKARAKRTVTHCNASNAMQRQRQNAEGKADRNTEALPTLQYAIPLELSALKELFVSAWVDFVSDRQERRKPVTSRAAKAILSRLSEKPDRAIEAIRKMIEKGWTSFEWAWLDTNGYKAAKPDRREKIDVPITRR